MIDLYVAALKAAPRARPAPVALYRCGLAYMALGSGAKAEKNFQEILANWPGHPLAGQCWLQLAKIFQKKESYLEAIEATRAAMRRPLEKADKTEAYYLLGKTLSLVGAHKEAIDTLNQCLTENSAFYLERPDLFKYLGESFFTIQQYEKSREYLFRYLNLQSDSPDRDLILAKIAEIFLTEGNQVLAGKLYNYIQSHYEDTEGDIIARIRKAEILETKGKGSDLSAEAVYEDVSKKNLSPPLRRVVNYKLAALRAKRGELDKALELVEQVLEGKVDPNVSQDEFVTLRGNILTEMIKKRYDTHDYTGVVSLYEKYGKLYAGRSEEIEILFAESFAELKLYPNAIEIYERVLGYAKNKKEDWMLKAAKYAFLLGDLDKAVQFCKPVQSPANDIAKTDILARTAYLQAKYADAVKLFSKIYQKDPSLLDPDGLYAYFRSLSELKKTEELLPLLEKSVSIIANQQPDKKLPFILLLSRCYVDLKQPQKAVATMESAVEATPSEEQKSELVYEIAKLYLSMGQTDNAVKKFNDLLSSPQSIWKVAAQQQLDSINMNKTKPNPGN